MSVQEFSGNSKRWAIVNGGLTLNSPLTTPVSNPRMVITAPCYPTSLDPDISFTFEAHFVPIKSGVVGDAHFDELIQSLHPDSRYFLCEGVSQEMADNITFEVNNLR